MSERGQRDDIDDVVARMDESRRRQRHQNLQGPVSAGPQAFLARGALAFASTSGTFLGTPTGDPYFFMVRVTDLDLKAGRIYQAVGLVEVQPHTSAADRDVRIGKNPTYANDPPSVGEGVTSHTLFGRDPVDSGLAVNDDQGAKVIVEWEQSADEDNVELALILDAGLEPTGFVDTTLGVYDRGRLV